MGTSSEPHVRHGTLGSEVGEGLGRRREENRPLSFLLDGGITDDLARETSVWALGTVVLCLREGRGGSSASVVRLRGAGGVTWMIVLHSRINCLSVQAGVVVTNLSSAGHELRRSVRNSGGSALRLGRSLFTAALLEAGLLMVALGARWSRERDLEWDVDLLSAFSSLDLR